MWSKIILGVLCFVVFSGSSWAGITLDRTRVIIDEGVREVSLLLANRNDYPVLTQLWVDDGDLNNDPSRVESSFLVLPPVFSLAKNKIQAARLVPIVNDLPKDREFLNWLNIYEVPPQDKIMGEEQRRILLTFRTQIKVIHRPKGLPYQLDEAVKKIVFSPSAEKILVENPTPYFISFGAVSVVVGNNVFEIDLLMLEPFSKQDFYFENAQNATEVKFSWIDDFGALHNSTVHLVLN